jgi:sugar (pentulose or hexulose) kinase
MTTPVIAIFDIGKTNKKLFLFDENYQMVYEQSAKFVETEDEDGFPCDNLENLRLSVFDSLRAAFSKKEYEIKAINFATYGASLVYIDEEGKALTPLYNYLKPYDPALQKQFYNTYGGEEQFSMLAASPVLGNLNSGMQLYHMKYEKPEIYARIKYALHLPQYMSFLLTGDPVSDITSIGCHTNLWDFTKSDYHEWVYKEGVIDKLAPLVPSNTVLQPAFPGTGYSVGIGLHDSSSALIPYLVSFHEPFMLISTGTWCISMNPFNDTPLTAEELQSDCLAYLTYNGQPVKSSRLFAGYEHEQQVKRIAEHFGQNTAKYRTVGFSQEIIAKLKTRSDAGLETRTKEGLKESPFGKRDLSSFADDTEAYHQLIMDLVTIQKTSTGLVMNSSVKRLFVDGGFSKNAIYMNLLAAAFPNLEIFSASMAQATAVGAALAIHSEWNSKPLPNDIIELKYYSVTQDVSL